MKRSNSVAAAAKIVDVERLEQMAAANRAGKSLTIQCAEVTLNVPEGQGPGLRVALGESAP